MLANIYAPNKDTPEFFQNTFKEMEHFHPQYLIVRGDLNLAMDSRIDRQSSKTNNDKSTKWLIEHMKQTELVDTFRHMYPDKNGFTWNSRRPPTFSRLDYFFTTESALQFIKKMEVLPSFLSDHCMLVMHLCLDPFVRGPGYWKLNNNLLLNKDYVESIKTILTRELEQENAKTYKQRWEIMVLEISGFTIKFSARKQKANRLKMEVLERKLHRLHEELQNINLVLFDDTYEQIRLVKHELGELVKEKTQGAIMRSRAKVAHHFEKPTKYFLNLERRNYNRKTIYRLKNDKDETIEKEKEILNEIKTYYEKLYTSVGEIDKKYVEKIKAQIPQVPSDLVEELDKIPTEKEIGEALFKLKNDKCPGTNGITTNFIKFFWPQLREFMHKLFLEIIVDGKFHLTAKRSIISLLEKIGKNELYLSNWRPLSLLNTENKIYSQMLAIRMQKALQKIIHAQQTGFLKGRYLAENIMRILEVIEKCDSQEQEAVLISFDFLKAFDSVQWETLFTALKAFGFGNKFIGMVKVLFCNPLATVMNNGYWSDWFSPTRVCRQGCCYSPGIFILTVELLGISIRNNKEIEGIRIGQEEIKAGQFANDLWSTLKAKEATVNAMLDELENFRKFSGLQINPQKSMILRLGPFKDSDAKFYTKKKLFWSPKPIKILGIYLFPEKQVIYRENFQEALHRVKDTLDRWKERNLTLMGKIVVINTLVSTIFIHKLLALPDPLEIFYKEYKQLVLDFIWDSKIPKIKYDRLIQRYENLGIKLIDMEIKNVALKAAWPI